MDFKLSDVPTWLLGVGVFAIGMAAVWVFILPGKGIELGGAYYGPYRLSDSVEKLRSLANVIDEVVDDKGFICVRYKGIPNRYCFEPNGQFSSSGNQGHWSLVH